jgi:hypothetical protein
MIPLATIVLASAFANSAPQEVSDSRDRLRVSARTAPSCEARPTGRICAFTVAAFANAKRATFAIPSSMRTLSAVRIVGPRRIVLVGTYDGFASGIIVVDSVSGSVISDDFAYFPAVSPNGRYLAFVRFFPEHFVTESESNDRVAFYDFRTPVAGSILRPHELVGTVVYPAEPVEADHAVQSEIDWLDADTFTFDDLVAGREADRVTVKLNGDVPSVSRIRIKPTRR